MSGEPEAEAEEPDLVPTDKWLAKRKKLIGWIFGATVALSLSIGLATAFTANPAPLQSAKQEDIGTVRQIYDGALYPDIQVKTFRNIDRLFPTRKIKRGTHTYPLPESDIPLKGVEFTSAGKKYDMYDYMSLNRVSGLLVLKNGKIAFEQYELGNTETTRRYFHSPSMTFAHYDFKRGSSIHEHFHPQEEVYEVIEGELELTIDGVKRVARQGLVGSCPVMCATQSKR